MLGKRVINLAAFCQPVQGALPEQLLPRGTHGTGLPVDEGVHRNHGRAAQGVAPDLVGGRVAEGPVVALQDLAGLDVAPALAAAL